MRNDAVPCRGPKYRTHPSGQWGVKVLAHGRLMCPVRTPKPYINHYNERRSCPYLQLPSEIAASAYLVLRRTPSTLMVPRGVAGLFFGVWPFLLALAGFRILKSITVKKTIASPSVAGTKRGCEQMSLQASLACSRYTRYSTIFGG